jgi:hypothetical protein
MQTHPDFAAIQITRAMSVQSQHKTAEHNIFVEKLVNTNRLQSAFVSSRPLINVPIQNPKADLLTTFSWIRMTLQVGINQGRFSNSGGTP